MSKTKTTVREYNDAGQMVKETITETETSAPVYVAPATCSCGLQGVWCNQHHRWTPAYQWYSTTSAPLVTSGTVTTAGQMYLVNGTRGDDDGLDGVTAKVS